jgi:hypothetical protein
MQTMNNLTINVTIDNGSDNIVILADDGYTPFCIPLTLEDAEKLNKELNIVIEREKDERNKRKQDY